MLFDTHFHLNDSEYNNFDKKELIDNANKKEVIGFVNISAEISDAPNVVKQAQEFNNVYAAIGYHPSLVDKATDADYQTLEKLLIKNKDGCIKAVGECGLDFYRKNNPSKEVQINHFIKHIKLAVKYDKTLVVHSRAAFEETYEVLKKYPNLRTIIHCSTYNKEKTMKFVKLGCYISFSGIVTFENAKEIQEAAMAVPIDKILCETDGPLLAPPPHRGKINKLEYVEIIYDKLEKLRNEKIKVQVLKNVKKVFNL